MTVSPRPDPGHLSLITASGIVHQHLTGAPLHYSGVAEMNVTLDRLARAIARVAPIRGRDALSGRERTLSEAEALECSFDNGASVACLHGKAVAYQLRIHRDDMRNAIALLQQAEARF